MIVDGGSCFEEPFGFFYCKFSTKKYQEPFLLWKSVKPSVNDCEISEFGWGADPQGKFLSLDLTYYRMRKRCRAESTMMALP